MLFASPLWLIGLLPWAGFTTWMLLGRKRRVSVPFIPLWLGQTVAPRTRPSLVFPPLPILLAIIGLLLTVIASARPMIPSNPRILHIYPEQSVSNLTIANIAARAIPRPQVMVELKDQNCATDFRNAQVSVQSGENSATQNVAIPRNGTVTAFVDLPALGPTISVDVDAPNDLAANNQAWLAREQSLATIEDSPTLPESLRRMIGVYRRHRETGGQRIEIVTNPADAPADQPAIVFAPDSMPASPSALRVQAYPMTTTIDWSAPTSDSGGGTAPPGWRSIVSNGSADFVAIRTAPARGVWVCLNSPTWPTRPDYVIFWTNVFDWLAGDSAYRWHPLDGRNPGIERRSDGSLRAYNAIDVDFAQSHPNDRRQLQSPNRPQATGSDLTPITCLIALVLMAIAILALAAN